MRAVVIGASRGIGWAFAEELVASGAEVHALSRSGTGPAGSIPGTLDLTDEKTVLAAATRIGEGAEIDLVIVAAGVLHDDGLHPEKRLADITADQLATYFAVNTIGPALAAKHFLGLLPRDRRAVFAALSARVGSISDNRLGGWYGYRASKAALNMVVKTLAIEVARSRPDAVCVTLHPGTVDTGLSLPFQRNVASADLASPQVAARRLLAVIDGLEPHQTGRCFAWNGEEIPA